MHAGASAACSAAAPTPPWMHGTGKVRRTNRSKREMLSFGFRWEATTSDIVYTTIALCSCVYAVYRGPTIYWYIKGGALFTSTLASSLVPVAAGEKGIEVQTLLRMMVPLLAAGLYTGTTVVNLYTWYPLVCRFCASF